nr:hypothetical protein [uncultured Anaeromusa sp.]
MQDGIAYNARFSGRELWQNISEEGNRHISEKLICKKNSELANKMIEDVFLSQNENRLY